MDLIGIDLDAEKARVLDELKAFRDVCLPAFFAPGGIEPVWDDDLPLGGPDVANRPSTPLAGGGRSTRSRPGRARHPAGSG